MKNLKRNVYLTMNKKRAIIIGLIGVLLVGIVAGSLYVYMPRQKSNLGQNPNPKGNTKEENVVCSFEKKIDIQYGTGATRSGAKKQLYLDAYIPTECDGTKVTEKRAPILVIHGGGFSSGDKLSPEDPDGAGSAAQYAQKLAERGYATFSMNYRMLKDKPLLETNRSFILKKIDITEEDLRAGKVKGDQLQVYLAAVATEDALKAQRYLNENSAKFGIDTARWGLTGMSAGAVTVMGMAYAADDWFDTDAHAKAVVSLWGGFEEKFVEPGETDLLMTIGTEDTRVPYARAVELYKNLQSVIETRLITVKGYGHGLKPDNLYTVMDPDTDQSIFEDVVQYFDEKL